MAEKTTYIVAFNAFQRGNDVYLLPNKCRFDKESPWVQPFKVWVENPFKRTKEEFKKIIK
jgi:hypothetical protein